MKMFRAHRSELNVHSRLRPAAAFEQLEQRYLLSADLWHAADAYVASQSAIAANYSLGHNNLRGVESSSPMSDLGGRLNFTPRSSISPATSLSSTAWAAAVDDAFENNDSFYQATNLGTISQPSVVNNLVMADQADWYQFRLNQTASATANVAIQFQSTSGDLDLAIYNSGGRLLGYSNGISNSEVVSLSGLSAGTYYVHVYGYRGVTNPNYSLTVSPGVASTTPSPTPNVPTPSNPTPTTPVASGYQIDMNVQGLTASQQAIFRDAALHWEQVVVGDVPDVVYNGRTVDDLLIDVSAGAIDGPGGTLGGANADRFRSGSLLPYHGTIQFDSADLASMEANGTLREVVLHEIGHVLGIGTLWQSLGLLVGAGTSHSGFIGPLAVAEYNTLTGGHATAVPVENAGGSGTRDAHWRESVFGSELMTGYVGPGTNLPLSRLTIASLADLGYQVNMNAADPYRLS